MKMLNMFTGSGLISSPCAKPGTAARTCMRRGVPRANEDGPSCQMASRCIPALECVLGRGNVNYLGNHDSFFSRSASLGQVPEAAQNFWRRVQSPMSAQSLRSLLSQFKTFLFWLENWKYLRTNLCCCVGLSTSSSANRTLLGTSSSLSSSSRRSSWRSSL